MADENANPNIPPTVEEDEECISEAVCLAALPPETEEEFDFQLRKDQNLYGHLFKRKDDLELFSMLPIQPHIKKQVIQRAIELEQESRLSQR